MFALVGMTFSRNNSGLKGSEAGVLVVILLLCRVFHRPMGREVPYRLAFIPEAFFRPRL